MSAGLRADQKFAAELIAAGESHRVVAEKLGKSKSTISTWAARADFQDLVAKLEARHAEVRKIAAETRPAEGEEHDFGKLARQAALGAFSTTVAKHRAGEKVPAAEWGRIAGILEKFSVEDTGGVSPDAIAEALADPKVAADVVAKLDRATQGALLAGLREAEFTRLREERDFEAPGVGAAFRVCERWASAKAAGEWMERWGPVLDLARDDLRRLTSLRAHREVATANGDTPEDAAVNWRVSTYPQIEAVVSAATPSPKEPNDAPTHE